MNAMRLHQIAAFTLDTVEKPVPKNDELLVKVGACGICGSDIPSVYELGTKVYPVTLGHEYAATVCAVGSEKNKGLLGKRAAVFPIIPCRACENCETGNYAQCNHYQYLGSRNDGGFAEYCLIPSAWHLVFSNNPAVSLEALSLVEPATVAQHAVRKGKVTAGDVVVIIGAGPIGIIAARWAKLFGARQVILLDILPDKIDFAQRRGLTIFNSAKEDVQKRVDQITGGRGADVVIEGTGTSGGINTGIACARTFGKVVLLGNPHKDTVIALNHHSMILRKELELVGIWNASYVNAPIDEWKYTVAMMDEGKLEVEDLITHRVSLRGLKPLFDQIYQREITICKAIYSSDLDE